MSTEIAHAVVFSTSGIDRRILGLAAPFYGLPESRIGNTQSVQPKEWSGSKNLPTAFACKVRNHQCSNVSAPEEISWKYTSYTTSPKNRKAETGHIYSETIDMLQPPEISSFFKARLHLDPRIEGYIAEKRHIHYTLNNVFNIIGDLLRSPGFHYRVYANLRVNDDVIEEEDKKGWERMELIIKFPDEHYDDIDEYWKNISKQVSNFYESLKNNPEFDEEAITKMRKFVYILVRSEE